MAFDCDVLIVGSGIIGATYARHIRELRPSTRIIMIEIGDHETREPGAHKKNNIIYQRDIDQFVHVIRSNLAPVSVPATSDHAPQMFGPPIDNSLVPRRGNPEQQPERNLPGQAVTRAVGGMGTHWTCSTPRFVGAEVPSLIADPQQNTQEWTRLYDLADSFIKVSNNQFPPSENTRQKLLLDTLGQDDATPLRLACVRDQDTGFVEWSSANTVFNFAPSPNLFELQPHTRCTSLSYNAQRGITGANVTDILTNTDSIITAGMYVIAAGAVATPQILFNSSLVDSNFPLPPTLGKYITEQPLAFCQTVIYKDLRGDIPEGDPEPQVMIPFDDSDAKDRPWHCQIHRDAFSYGKIPDTVKKQYIVDFRWFGRTSPRPENQLLFSYNIRDAFGMPQPTFHYTITEGDTEPNRMMRHMCNISNKIGRYLPGAGPQFMEPGLALHLGGTHRSGLDTEQATSVVNTYSQVWEIPNLYLGGVGSIPTAFASNPTLTAMGYAIRSAENIVLKLNQPE